MKEVVTFDGHCHLFDDIGDIMDGEVIDSVCDRIV